MGRLLRVLIVEDSADDAVLLVRELKRAGYDLIFERVDTAAAMDAALDIPTWDVILCDYVMPQFDALQALKLYKARALDIPFIVLSGVLGEYRSAETRKAGAHDYIMKSNLAQLVPAIEREMLEARTRQAGQTEKPKTTVLKRIQTRWR